VKKDDAMSDEIKKPEEITDAPVLSDTDLEQVAGGTHPIDKSSPALLLNTCNGTHIVDPPAK
jgi:type VI protein secretion system component Hcp